jgi:hypothetical protein
MTQIAETETPTTHRLTIEAFSVDLGTDLSECCFTTGAVSYSNGYTRQVLHKANGRARVVGLWRIVPVPADG